MVEIYAVPAVPQYAEFYFNNVFPLISPERKKKIQVLVQKEDALRSLAGEWLSRFAVSSKLGLQMKDIFIDCDVRGKPYMPKNRDLYFNVSHSEKWVVCALSTAQTGIDIELVQQTDISIAEDWFTKDENENLNKLDSEKEKLDYFYSVWTIKESFLKATGEGLSGNPRTIETNIRNGNISVYCDDGKNFHFKLFDFEKKYKLCVCSMDSDFNNDIIRCVPI